MYKTLIGTANENSPLTLTGALPELPPADGHEADVLGMFSPFVPQFAAIAGAPPADHTLHIRANAKRTIVYFRYVKNVVQGTSNKQANKDGNVTPKQTTAQARKAAQESAQGGTVHDTQGRAVTLPADFVASAQGVLDYVARKAANMTEGNVKLESLYLQQMHADIKAQLTALAKAEAAMSKAIAARDVALADCVAVLAPSRVQPVAAPATVDAPAA